MDFALKGHFRKFAIAHIELSHLFTIFTFAVVNLAVLSLSRLLLSTWQAEHFAASGDLSQVLLGGLRIDISTICYAIFPALALQFVYAIKPSHLNIKIVSKYYLLAISLLVTLLELITPLFFDYHAIRPSFATNTGRALFSSLLQGHVLELVVDVVTLFLLARVLSSLFDFTWQLKFEGSNHSHFGFALFLLALAVLGARGSLVHEPIDPSSVAFSSDPMLNQLSLNSAYSLGEPWFH